MSEHPHQPKEYCISCGNCKQEETGFKTKRPRCEITRWFLDMYSVQEMISKIGCKHDTRSRPSPAPAEPLFSETTLERVRRQARISFATTLHGQLKIKHKKGVVLTYDNVCDMIRESLRQEPPAP